MKKLILLYVFAGWLAARGPAQDAIIRGTPSTPNSAPLAACGQPFTDTRDGKVYTTVLIGAQCWMKENLNTGVRLNGGQEQTDNGIIEKYCMQNDTANCSVYGGLYQWNEMMQYVSVPGLQGICPSGFFLPADADWNILQTFLGGMQVAGGKMKETGYVHWHGPNTGATNESGFTAFGSGYRHLSGYFYDFLNWAKFWSSTGYDAEWASYRELSYDNAWLTPNYYKKVSGFAVRCLKGETPSPPENRSLQNISIPDGQVNCYDATHTITVAGEGTAFAIMGGGSATMIAGQNIIYRPAVTVHPGGYLHGYITTTEQYCDTKAPSVPAAVPGENRQPATINNSFAGVYPNPTAGSFTLELSGVNQTEKVKVEIRSLPGDKVFVFTLQGGFRHGFSLSDMPAGVYIVHVVTGGRAEAFKIIKN